MDKIETPLRLYHTLRWLKPVQFYGRALHWLWRPQPPTTPRLCQRTATGTWIPPATRTQSLFGPTRFRALQEERSIATPLDWDDPAVSKLWRYNLHYFDDLNSVGALDRREWHQALLQRWIAENPPARGTGWESFPVSLRIVNWIKWHLGGAPSQPAWDDSLATQARWLETRLERHLLGNHLFANAKALLFAGSYFEGAEAERWVDCAQQIMTRELPEQVLVDGGHFERSPMYHALVYEDVLDVLNLSNAFPGLISESLVVRLRDAATLMRFWLARLTHPDGDLAFFNDTAFGVAPATAELERYAQQLGVPAPQAAEPCEHLAASGYVRGEAGPAVLLVDLALVGPDYLPGHAHADTLSFELSLWGNRWFVNSGCSEYGTGPERRRQRGTPAHNTVTFDRLDSSEVWSGFRVARRARPFGVHVIATEPIRIEGSHDGYLRLPGSVVHSRRWTLTTTSLEIEDRGTGHWTSAVGHLHLHPDVNVVLIEAGCVTLRRGDRSITLTVEGAELSTQLSTWHPEFGRTVPNLRLVVTASADCWRTRIDFGA